MIKSAKEGHPGCSLMNRGGKVSGQEEAVTVVHTEDGCLGGWWQRHKGNILEAEPTEFGDEEDAGERDVYKWAGNWNIKQNNQSYLWSCTVMHQTRALSWGGKRGCNPNHTLVGTCQAMSLAWGCPHRGRGAFSKWLLTKSCCPPSCVSGDLDRTLSESHQGPPWELWVWILSCYS